MYLAVFSFALASYSSDLTAFVLACFGVAALICILIFFLDIKNQHRERAAGKKVTWYKRPTLFTNGTVLCFLISEVLNLLIVNNTLPPLLFFYILISLLIVCGLSSAIYSLKLARQQRKLALEQLELARDQQKAQRSK